MGILSNNLRNMALEKPENRYKSYLKIGNATMFKMPENGNVLMDVIPYRVTSQTYHDYNPNSYSFVKSSPKFSFTRSFAIHRKIGAEERNIICPTSLGLRCPICEEQRVFTENFKNKAKRDEWREKGFSPQYRQLVNFYDLSKADGVMYVWDVPVSYFLKVILAEIKNDSSYENFAEIENGLTLNVKFRPGEFKDREGKPTPVVKDISFLKRNKDYTLADIDKAYNLDDMLDVLPYEDVSQLFFNGVIENKSPAPEVSKAEVPKSASTVADTRQVSKGVCPHGHEFGKDALMKESCASCDQTIWNACCQAKR